MWSAAEFIELGTVTAVDPLAKQAGSGGYTDMASLSYSGTINDIVTQYLDSHGRSSRLRLTPDARAEPPNEKPAGATPAGFFCDAHPGSRKRCSYSPPRS